MGSLSQIILTAKNTRWTVGLQDMICSLVGLNIQPKATTGQACMSTETMLTRKGNGALEKMPTINFMLVLMFFTLCIGCISVKPAPAGPFIDNEPAPEWGQSPPRPKAPEIPAPQTAEPHISTAVKPANPINDVPGDNPPAIHPAHTLAHYTSLGVDPSLIRLLLEAANLSGDDSRDLSKRIHTPNAKVANKNAAAGFNAEGHSALKNNDLSTALYKFKLAYENDMTNAEYSGNYGYLLFMTGDLLAAEKLLLYSLQISPRRASAWFTLGEVYAYMNDEQTTYLCFLNTCKFTTGLEKTKSFLLSKTQSSESTIVKSKAQDALQKCEQVYSGVSTKAEPAPQSRPQATVTPSNNALSPVLPNSVVAGVKFFNSDKTAPPLNARRYGNSFKANQICYLWSQIEITHNKSSNASISLRVTCQDDNNREVFNELLPVSINPEYRTSYHATGWGNSRCDAWRRGVYRVRFLMNNTVVGEGQFTVID